MARFQLASSTYLSRDTAPDLVKADGALHSTVCPSEIKEVPSLSNLFCTCCVENIITGLTLRTALAVGQVFQPTKFLLI